MAVWAGPPGREDLGQGSRAVGSSKDIRAVVGEVVEGGGEDGDQDGNHITIWRFMYEITIPRKLSEKTNGKSLSCMSTLKDHFTSF